MRGGLWWHLFAAANLVVRNFGDIPLVAVPRLDNPVVRDNLADNSVVRDNPVGSRVVDQEGKAVVHQEEAVGNHRGIAGYNQVEFAVEGIAPAELPVAPSLEEEQGAADWSLVCLQEQSLPYCGC